MRGDGEEPDRDECAEGGDEPLVEHLEPVHERSERKGGGDVERPGELVGSDVVEELSRLVLDAS
jgi:hypothetical protein